VIPSVSTVSVVNWLAAWNLSTTATPWDFRCPQYDQRSSNFVNAGTHYGVGHRQPVGHEGNPKSEVAALPRTRRNTLQDDDLG